MPSEPSNYEIHPAKIGIPRRSGGKFKINNSFFIALQISSSSWVISSLWVLYYTTMINPSSRSWSTTCLSGRRTFHCPSLVGPPQIHDCDLHENISLALATQNQIIASIRSDNNNKQKVLPQKGTWNKRTRQGGDEWAEDNQMNSLFFMSVLSLGIHYDSQLYNSFLNGGNGK